MKKELPFPEDEHILHIMYTVPDLLPNFRMGNHRHGGYRTEENRPSSDYGHQYGGAIVGKDWLMSRGVRL